MIARAGTTIQGSLRSSLDCFKIAGTASLLPIVARVWIHPLLGVDANGIRNSVDEIEITDDLDGNRDRFVIESVLPHPIDVALVHPRWIQR